MIGDSCGSIDDCIVDSSLFGFEREDGVSKIGLMLILVVADG